MVDELLSRRSSFRPGQRIRLADGQGWTFPLPIQEWSDKAHSDREEYYGLIRSIIEAEDDSERRLAELAFAIFLLSQNYRLSPLDYQQLLDFGSETSESIAWRTSLRQLSEAHTHCFSATLSVTPETDLCSTRQQRISRLVEWLRDNVPLHWRFFDSGSY
jgi:hypothetical protein